MSKLTTLEALQVHRQGRQAMVFTIYRWLVGFGFLVVAFSALPEYRAVVAWGFLLFQTTVAGLATQIGFTLAAMAHDAERSDRKTRHTILLMPEQSEWGDAFWAEVENRLDQESPRLEALPGFWGATFRVLGSVALQAAGDVVGIGIALALAS